MFNLGLGDQSKGGSLLDTVLQIAFPAYGLMRNAQGLFEPEHREGTLTGWGMNKLEEPGGFFGSDQPQGKGLIGNGWDEGSYVDMGGYGYGTMDGTGVEDANDEGGWSSNPSADAMAHSEVGSYASYDAHDEF
jgi:hypothetical protein